MFDPPCRDFSKRTPPGGPTKVDIWEKIITRNVSWRKRGKFRRLCRMMKAQAVDILSDVKIQEEWHMFNSKFVITVKGTKSQIPFVESLVENLLVV